jgi:heptosyltransferase II
MTTPAGPAVTGRQTVSPIPSRIVVRSVNWLGDAILSTPALQRLREAYPGAEITLLVAEKLASLFQSHPAVDRLLTFDAGESVWQVGRRVRSGRFDLGIVLPNSPRSAMELWLGRVPRRVGIHRRFRSWLLTQAVDPAPGETRMRKLSAATIRQLLRQPTAARHFQPAPGAHQMYHYLHLMAALGADPTPMKPMVEVTPEEMNAVRAKFGLEPDHGPWLALNAGAAYGSAKRWPPERFVEAAIELQRHGHGRWLVVGGAGDAGLATRIVEGIRRGLPPKGPDGRALEGPLCLAGQTSLRELAAVLALAKAMLTNDTGPMHLGAAVGTSVVVPFGSTSPDLTGPGLPGDDQHRVLRSTVPCSPCFRRDCPIDLRCMRTIPVAAVVRAFEEVLQQAGDPFRRGRF